MGFGRASAQMSSKWSEKVPSKFKWFHRFIILILFIGVFLFPFKLLTEFLQINLTNTSFDLLSLVTCAWGSILIGGPAIVSINYFIKYYEIELSNNFYGILAFQMFLFLVAILGLFLGWNFFQS